MTPLLIKGLIAVGGIGLGGIGIWQLNEYMAPKTIREKLEREGYKFHGFGENDDKDGWKKLAESYKGATGSDEGTKISGVTISNSTVTEEDGKTLKNACKVLVDKPLGEANSEQDVNRVRRWCVKPGINPGSPGS